MNLQFSFPRRRGARVKQGLLSAGKFIRLQRVHAAYPTEDDIERVWQSFIGPSVGLCLGDSPRSGMVLSRAAGLDWLPRTAWVLLQRLRLLRGFRRQVRGMDRDIGVAGDVGLHADLLSAHVEGRFRGDSVRASYSRFLGGHNLEPFYELRTSRHRRGSGESGEKTCFRKPLRTPLLCGAVRLSERQGLSQSKTMPSRSPLLPVHGPKAGQLLEVEAFHEPSSRSAGCPTCRFADCQSAAWARIERSRITERSRVGNPRNGRLGSLRYGNAAPVHGRDALFLNREAVRWTVSFGVPHSGGLGGGFQALRTARNPCRLMPGLQTNPCLRMTIPSNGPRRKAEAQTGFPSLLFISVIREIRGQTFT